MAAVTGSFMHLFFLCCLFLKFMSQTGAEPDGVFCYEDRGNYTANSIYKTNLNTLLSTLSSHTQINYGFYNFSYGQSTDRVNAVGLCRGDVKPDECRSCLNNSRGSLTENCPNQKEAVLWFDKCMLRYSNRTIFGIVDTDPPLYTWYGDKATNVDQFIQVLWNLMGNLKATAASGDSRRKYATGNATASNFQNIYGFVQCTPDLSQQECRDCLDLAFSEARTCCDGRRGARIMAPTCNIKYDYYRFFEETTVLDPEVPVPPLPPKESGNTTGIVIAIVVSTVVVFLLCLCGYWRWRKAGKHLLVKGEEDDEDEIKIAESLQFNLDTIRAATGNFSDSNKLGQGGFGDVYRGRLSDGQMIAVKRLSRESSQADTEFKNEVLLVAKLQHRNLVRLLGFCLEGRERLLVYEFVPNRSLDYFIFDETMKPQLDWKMRYNIIRGIARGLLYLHEDSRLRVIHRDLKASNILLDKEMNPKIADFGVARLVSVDQTQAKTSRIVGTYGYMAPEYVIHGQFSVKSDVFSFGVLVLEIVSGQKNNGLSHWENVGDLVTFAWRNWKEDTTINIVDPSLTNNCRNEMMRCIHIGLLCVQEKSYDRPTMATIMLMLNSHSVSLPIPAEPSFYMNSRTRSLSDM
ncbi:hypothetical protein Fmac_023376 [Flemingia macrophylla]|uniref:Cysteine-rich receptor-like protein kinase 29 n=1 Tax=Flemingia macrophylla TaxID=520843 RepID=A0ABD1LLV9_9FABA